FNYPPAPAVYVLSLHDALPVCGIWLSFHNHAGDQRPIDGRSPYEIFIERTDPAVVRHQLDTGNSAMAGIDPITYVERYGDRFWRSEEHTSELQSRENLVGRLLL